MNVFLTGATGYLGGAVAARLTRDGHTVRGLTRRPEHADGLAAAGITPVLGDLDDGDLLTDEARRADGFMNAADSDHRAAAETLVAALAGSGRPLLHTSGTSIVGDDAKGEECSPRVFDDDGPVHADGHPVRRGPRRDTALIPPLVAQARASGVVRVVGHGRNRWSTVHVDDVAALYGRVLGDGSAAGFYFVENGEASLAGIGAAVARRLGLREVQPWSLADAAAAWGEGLARYALGSNSRVRATRARRLGWAPAHTSITRWIEREMPLP